MEERFVFNDPAPAEIYTLSLHDALPIYPESPARPGAGEAGRTWLTERRRPGTHHDLLFTLSFRDVGGADRKSTRLNSSHANISYAVFCLLKNLRSHQMVPSLFEHSKPFS